MIAHLIQYLRNRLKRVIQVCCMILALLLGFDALFLNKDKAHTAAENLPGLRTTYTGPRFC